MPSIQKSESIFWSLVGVSAVYVIFTFLSPARASMQVAAQSPSAPSTQGMGCMAKGGGCGCGGMMKK